jgi:hypothetical protein
MTGFCRCFEWRPEQRSEKCRSSENLGSFFELKKEIVCAPAYLQFIRGKISVSFWTCALRLSK